MDLNKELWIGSTIDVRTGEAAEKALHEISDHKYWSDENGIVKVDRERWEIAQRYEHDCWMKHATTANSDRHDEHFNKFGGYESLPNNIGNVVEIGCGPFTQLLSIIGRAGKTPTKITLCDPLANSYLSHPHCSYRQRSIISYHISEILSIPAEEFTLTGFDTAVCINVLEHVMDANVVLDNLFNCLKKGGLLVFSERSWDTLNTKLVYDAGHPIRLKECVLEAFRSRFEEIYRNDDYFIGKKPQ